MKDQIKYLCTHFIHLRTENAITYQYVAQVVDT